MNAAAQEPRPVTPADVVIFPPPGAAAPSAFAYTPDGSAITYLHSEDFSNTKVLWRASADGKATKVIARPPGEGDTDANVSPEEALRRERQRQRAAGISQVARAAKADVIAIPIRGDIYAIQGEGPLLRLTETPEPELDPRPNPQGTRVASVRNGDLYVVDVATRKQVRLTEGVADGLTNGLAEFIAQEELGRDAGYWWSPDGARIAYQQTDEREIPLFTITHQGEETPSVETHRYPFSGAANAKVKLGVVSADGGPTRWLEFAEPGADVYLARIDWESPTSLLVQVLSRDQARLDLVRINAKTGERSSVFSEVSKPWYNLHDDLRVLEKSGEILWTSERSGFRHIELYGRDGKKVRDLTSSQSPIDFWRQDRGPGDSEGARETRPSSEDWAVDKVVAVDEGRREVWFLAATDGRYASRMLYRVSLDGGTIFEVSRAPGMSEAAIAPDGKAAFVVASSMAGPPGAAVVSREGGAAQPLELNKRGKDPLLDQFWMVQPQLIEVVTAERQVLQGAYYPPLPLEKQRLGNPSPVATEGKRWPLVVMVYGGPHVQLVGDSWALKADLTAQALAGAGFAVWKLDNRGSWRRGLAFEGALDRRMGTVEVEDQVLGVKALLASHPELDPERIGITGGSYGGYMTLKCLIDAPDVFRSGVSLAPVTDWDGYDTGYTERYMGTPKGNPEGYKVSSVLAHADKLERPVLLIHGLLDENVHFRHTARLVSRLIAANKPFELVAIPDERHSARKPANRKYQIERMIDFFKRTLGAP